MRFIDEIQQIVEAMRRLEVCVWKIFKKHHQDYMSALQLNFDDLKVLEEFKKFCSQYHDFFGSQYPDIAEIGAKGFLQFKVDGEEFSLHSISVCGNQYDGQWENMILVFCTSNLSLNESFGLGTALITVVPEEWRQKIVIHLAKYTHSDGVAPAWLPKEFRDRW